MAKAEGLLDDVEINDIKRMAKAEGYKIPSKDKNKMISEIKKQYSERKKKRNP